MVIRENSALGVHLLNFTAAKTAGGSQVAWLTENEQNYTHFTVQRSLDNGVSYSILGGITSSGQSNYSLVDKNPARGANVYRLQMEDLNGNITYSSAITLMYSGVSDQINNSGLSVYPNPAKSGVTLTIKPAITGSASGNSSAASYNYGIKVVNSLGIVAKTASIRQNSWQTDVSSLLPGKYIIQVINNDSKIVIGEVFLH